MSTATRFEASSCHLPLSFTLEGLALPKLEVRRFVVVVVVVVGGGGGGVIIAIIAIVFLFFFVFFFCQ